MAIIPFGNGAAGEWNDVSHLNQLYFVVEHNTLLLDNTFKTITLTLYPNPAKDSFTITTDGIMAGVTITNASGQQVKQVQNTGISDGVVDVSNLAGGVYFVAIVLEDGTRHLQKLVKQ